MVEDKLNLSFNRFDSVVPLPARPMLQTSPLQQHLHSCSHLSSKHSILPLPQSSVSCRHGPPPPPLSQKKERKRLKVRKATGLNGISPRLFWECADQLNEVVLYMFNLHLHLKKVPDRFWSPRQLNRGNRATTDL